MELSFFNHRLNQLNDRYEALIQQPNQPLFSENGIYERYLNPVLTNRHVPLEWRYDLNDDRNPYYWSVSV